MKMQQYCQPNVTVIISEWVLIIFWKYPNNFCVLHRILIIYLLSIFPTEIDWRQTRWCNGRSLKDPSSNQVLECSIYFRFVSIYIVLISIIMCEMIIAQKIIGLWIRQFQHWKWNWQQVGQAKLVGSTCGNMLLTTVYKKLLWWLELTQPLAAKSGETPYVKRGCLKVHTCMLLLPLINSKGVIVSNK